MIAEMINKIKGGQLLSLTNNEKECLVKILEKEQERETENSEIDTKVINLVKEEFKKMHFSKTESNRAILSNKCQEIIYKEWGFSTDYLWKLVDETVEELIPGNMD
ncbi:hypothetical protein [Bacillus paranthracis]|uniref:hypothetical protein n=1 Tax=Bacillus paranthracis TaxID=2026186 RepID=UPI002FDC4542|nr:hypothetical protein [Bacillus paranthracis]